MSRYIDADALLERSQAHLFCVGIRNGKSLLTACKNYLWLHVNDAPTADVAPVVHAKWDVNGHCTNCGGHAPFYYMTYTYYKSPYCFECGAKIDCEDESND